MRKFLYKAELDDFFKRNKWKKKNRTILLSTLFEDSVNRQCHLRGSICTPQELTSAIQSIGSPNLSEILDLFAIESDLKIPSDLKDLLLQNDSVAVFVGAGVSKLWGYPLWKELAKNAIEYLSRNSLISHYEKDKLLAESSDPKFLLSIFDMILEQKDKKALKEEFYKSQFRKPVRPPELRIDPYDLIASNQFNWVKVTSNVDQKLAESIARASQLRHSQVLPDNSVASSPPAPVDDPANLIIKTRNNFLTANLNKDRVLHLHGLLDDVDSLIFTTSDYVKHYYDLDSDIHKFLHKLFEQYHVVFIGYGLEEFAILEAVFSKLPAKKHFILLPTYYNEPDIFRMKCAYFKSLNVTAIPYYLDSQGYYRLLDVLEAWREELTESQTDIHKGEQEFLRNLIEHEN